MSEFESEEQPDFDALFDDAEAKGLSMTIVSPDMMRKRITWDIAPCDSAEQVAIKIGLQPASSEVEEMEHFQSHGRLQAVAMLAPVIQMTSVFSAEVVRGAMMVEHGDAIGDEQILEAEKLAPLIFATALAIIAELNDVGLIHLGPMGTHLT